MANTILLVDDDTEVLEINEKYFVQKGYKVELAHNFDEAKEKLRKKLPNCIVLDVMMPGQNGFTVCKTIKANFDVPIIFLTGRDSEDDVITGLSLGADDYMIKPYSLKELDMRIKLLINRYERMKKSTHEELEYPPLRIDIHKGIAYCNDEEIPLSQKEYAFLRLLVESPQKVFSFEEIGEQVWGGYFESDRKTIMVTASRLRKKIDSYPGLQNCIETVYSKGYTFVPR